MKDFGGAEADLGEIMGGKAPKKLAYIGVDVHLIVVLIYFNALDQYKGIRDRFGGVTGQKRVPKSMSHPLFGTEGTENHEK